MENTKKNKENQDNSILNSLEELFKYLNNFHDQLSMTSDEKALGAFRLLFCYPVWKNDRTQMLNLSFKYNFCSILVKMLQAKYERLESDLSENAELAFSRSALSFSCKSLDLVREFTNKSAQFTAEFIELNGVELLFKYLRNQALTSAFIGLSRVENGKRSGGAYEMLEGIVRGAIGCLLNLSKVYRSTREKWRPLREDLIGLLLSLSERLRSVNDCQLAIYMVLSFITEEVDLENIERLRQVIVYLSDMIGNLCAKLAANSNEEKYSGLVLERNTNNLLDEQTWSAQEACSIVIWRAMWYLLNAELLNGLSHMAVCDQVRLEIYEERRMKQHLRAIIFSGGEAEVEYALKLLAQLCLDKRVARSVCQSSELVEKIELIKANDHSSNRASCEEILRAAAAASEQQLNVIEEGIQAEQVLMAKEQLKESREEEEEASSIESQAGSLESLRKSMESGTSLHGAVEEVVEDSKPLTAIEVQPKLEKKEEEEEPKTPPPPLSIRYLNRFRRPKSNRVQTTSGASVEAAIDWNEIQVEKWLRKKRIDIQIQQNLKPCDGKVLFQMHSILSNAPEFFYMSMTRRASSSSPLMSSKEAAKFAYELLSLFKK